MEALVRIQAILNELWTEKEGSHIIQITRDTALSSLGLDSLGLAVLVLRLDEEFGIDPFTDLDLGSFPQVCGDLADAYSVYNS